MAKQSYIKGIKAKQHSPYSGVSRSPAAIHALQGLRSWPLTARGISQDALDEEAERRMNPQGWSARKNPICPICQIQKSITGECYC
jgi:hypothetical protein